MQDQTHGPPLRGGPSGPRPKHDKPGMGGARANPPRAAPAANAPIADEHPANPPPTGLTARFRTPVPTQYRRDTNAMPRPVPPGQPRRVTPIRRPPATSHRPPRTDMLNLSLFRKYSNPQRRRPRNLPGLTPAPRNAAPAGPPRPAHHKAHSPRTAPIPPSGAPPGPVETAPRGATFLAVPVA